MTGRDEDRDDLQLAAALRIALERRDDSTRAPRFATLWSRRGAGRNPVFTWWPLAASVLTAAVVAVLLWTLGQRPDIDPTLARQLSSADYWRVPTDELLAYEAAPLRADLPTPTGLQISLEESLL